MITCYAPWIPHQLYTPASSLHSFRLSPATLGHTLLRKTTQYHQRHLNLQKTENHPPRLPVFLQPLCLIIPKWHMKPPMNLKRVNLQIGFPKCSSQFPELLFPSLSPVCSQYLPSNLRGDINLSYIMAKWDLYHFLMQKSHTPLSFHNWWRTTISSIPFIPLLTPFGPWFPVSAFATLLLIFFSIFMNRVQAPQMKFPEIY